MASSEQRRRQELRGKLRTLVALPLMRGSIVERVRVCGKPRCACADDPGARHPGRYLSVHLDGRTQVVHLRPADVPAVQEAIAGYEALWATVTALTALEVARLRQAAQERRRGRRRRAGR
jgi:hypothetical protein